MHKHVPRRVKGAAVQKLSTAVFDYQIEVINEFSKTSGWSNGSIYRYAIDYFLIAFKRTIKRKIPKGLYPKELNKLTEKQMRKLAEVITTR